MWSGECAIVGTNPTVHADKELWQIHYNVFMKEIADWRTFSILRLIVNLGCQSFSFLALTV